MAAEPTPLHPAVQFLKDNAVVIGLVLVVAVSVAVFAVLQGGSKSEAKAEVKPTVSSSAELETADPTGAASPAAGPETSAPAGAAAAPSTGAQQPAVPAPAPTATPRVIGTGPQAVTAKDWKPYAKDFAAAWANTADGKDAWLSRLKPLVSASLYEGFTRTDIRTVPNATLDSVSLAEESPAAKTFTAYSTSGPLLQGRVSIQPDGSWLVDQVGPPKR